MFGLSFTIPPEVWWIISSIVAALLVWRMGWVLRCLFGLVIIPEDKIGMVTKKFTLWGGRLPNGQIMALNGEAGYQIDTLPPGIHLGFFSWWYAVEIGDLTRIESTKLGQVTAIDGKPIPVGRVLGRAVECNHFQDGRAFLANGGERGTQIGIIPPGTYRINTKLFTVTMVEAITVADTQTKDPVSGNVVTTSKIGIVTVLDGVSLPAGEIAGPEIPGHNSFQDAQAFMGNGGFKGLQTPVLLPGLYFINPRFAKVDMIDLTLVPVAHVGVVISYVGAEGEDISGEGFRHGNLVKRNEKGVWETTLDPGKYPINTRTHRVVQIPTSNIVLNWATGRTESHKLDQHLSTITVRSADGFSFNLDVSQIIHVSPENAPKVVARFGSIEAMVTQVLEPLIGNYFRNAAQGMSVIDFLTNRAERQKEAKKAIGDALREYDVVAVDTLIGDIAAPPTLMATLTDRKIAEQQEITFENQKKAQEARQALQRATALADTQHILVDSERRASVAEFDANAAIRVAEGQAKAKTLNAEADARVLELVGNAEAVKITAIGEAEANILKLKVEAVGAQGYVGMQIAVSFANGQQALVPHVLVNGGGENGGNLIQGLLAMTVAQKAPDAVANVQSDSSVDPKGSTEPTTKAA